MAGTAKRREDRRESKKKLEPTHRVASRLVKISEKKVLGGDHQKIHDNHNHRKNQRNSTIDMRFLKGEIEGKTTGAATSAVSKLKETQGKGIEEDTGLAWNLYFAGRRRSWKGGRG